MLDENGDIVAGTTVDPVSVGDAPLGCDENAPDLNNIAGISLNGTGAVELGTDSYVISAAMIDEPFESNERLEVYMVIHDGESRDRRLESGLGDVQIDCSMTRGSVALIAKMSAAGVDGVENRTFEISATGDSTSPASNDGDVATDVVLAIDSDNSGQFSAAEGIVIVEGQITWVGSKPDITITINALTANGVSVTGSYSGDYVEIPSR